MGNEEQKKKKDRTDRLTGCVCLCVSESESCIIEYVNTLPINRRDAQVTIAIRNNRRTIEKVNKNIFWSKEKIL